MPSQENPEHAWHRQPWVWFVIGLLVTTMLASFAMLYIATANAPDLVVEDYSKIEEISAVGLARSRRASELGLSASLDFAPTDGGPSRVTVQLNSPSNNVLPDSIFVALVHSTIAAYDSRHTLSGSNGRYTGEMPLPPGAYYLEISDSEQNWKLNTRINSAVARVEIESSPLR